eukprot:g36359.t1
MLQCVVAHLNTVLMQLCGHWDDPIVVQYLIRMGGLLAHAGLELAICLTFNYLFQEGKSVVALLFSEHLIMTKVPPTEQIHSFGWMLSLRTRSAFSVSECGRSDRFLIQVSALSVSLLWLVALKHLIDGSNCSIHSAQEFLNLIKNSRIDEDKIMVSFD